MPVHFLNKKTKKTPMHEKKKPSGLTMTGLERGSHGRGIHSNHHHNNNNNNNNHHNMISAYSSTVSTPSTADSVSLHNFSLSTISKASSDDNQSFTSTNGLQHQLSLGGIGKRSRASSFLRSPLSPGGFGSLGLGSFAGGRDGSNGTGTGGSGGHPRRAFPKLHPMMQHEEPALVHCPPSVGSLDQFSSERQAWVRDCLAQNQNLKPHLPQQQQQQQQTDDILKTGRAWDTTESHFEEQGCTADLIAPGRR